MRKDNTLNLASTEVPTLYQKNVAINIYVRRTTAGLHVTKAHHNVRTGTMRTRARACVCVCVYRYENLKIGGVGQILHHSAEQRVVWRKY